MPAMVDDSRGSLPRVLIRWRERDKLERAQEFKVAPNDAGKTELKWWPVES